MGTNWPARGNARLNVCAPRRTIVHVRGVQIRLKSSRYPLLYIMREATLPSYSAFRCCSIGESTNFIAMFSPILLLFGQESAVLAVERLAPARNSKFSVVREQSAGVLE